MSGKSILVVGATSAIAYQAIRVLLPQYRHYVLAARNAERLAQIASELRSSGAESVHLLSYDAERDTQRDLVGEACVLLGDIPTAVLIAHGMLPPHDDARLSSSATESVLRINTVSVLALCAHTSRYFEKRGSGILAVISSVAADRARKNSYLYAASKAALDVYLDGLHLRWRAQSPELRVLTIKPGFVQTPMTAHLERMLLSVTAECVGIAIARLIVREKHGRRYIPWWWRLIMLIVRGLPSWVMRRVRV